MTQRYCEWGDVACNNSWTNYETHQNVYNSEDTIVFIEMSKQRFNRCHSYNKHEWSEYDWKLPPATFQPINTHPWTNIPVIDRNMISPMEDSLLMCSHHLSVHSIHLLSTAQHIASTAVLIGDTITPSTFSAYCSLVGWTQTPSATRMSFKDA